MTTILVFIIAIVGLFLIAALFAGKEFTVSREAVFDRQKDEVFNYIKFLENHISFSKWTTKDNSKKVNGLGVDGTPGYILKWNNYAEKAGVGELKILDIKDGERIDLEHNYFKPVKGIAKASLITERLSENQTKVKWVYSGFSNYPINLLTSLMNMDKIVGRDLETGLRKLREALEKNGSA